MKCSFIFFLLFSVGLVSSQFNPLKNEKICGRPSCKGQHKFKYLPGKRYDYEYSTIITTFSENVNGNKSVISVRGDVSLFFLTPCDGLLELSNFKFNDKDVLKAEKDYTENVNDDFDLNDDTFSEVVSKNSMRFSFNDGVISEVCSDETEENWVLNFKKGILTMLNNNMRRFDLDYSGNEEDIHGKCLASYKLQKSRDTALVIEKSKELSTCSSRSKLESSLQTTPYNFKPKQQNSKLLKAFSTCELIIKSNIYDNIVCNESHNFQSFATKTSDATTIVNQNLKFISDSPDERSVDDLPSITKRSTLIYDHKLALRITKNNLENVEISLKKLCKSSDQDAQAPYAETFSSLIQNGRTLTYDELSGLINNANVLCPDGKKFILEALPYLGSDGAVTTIKDMALRNEIRENTLRSWITTISFIPNPSSEALAALYELLKEKTDDSVIALAISTLVHTFCKQNPNCLSVKEPNDIVTLLENRINNFIEKKKNLPQKFSEDDEYQTFVALKSVGNIGTVTESFLPFLDNLVEDTTLDNKIRIGIIEVYRRLPCESQRSLFEKIYKNEEDDSEVRIAAYLQIMKCPDYNTIQSILNTLQNEQVNQVGSFVWSHLNNILKSSILNRIEIQGMLNDNDLKKKFSKDVRKFSQNFEGSLFFDEYDVGANYDSNIIFSPSSYIPRSSMLNMTVELFGESINLFEIYGRFEGFEHYIESLFGQNGQFNYNKLKDKLLTKSSRSPRNINRNGLEEDINDLEYELKNNFDNPKISAGFKIFGNDMRYEHLVGEEQIKSTLKKLDILEYMKQILSGKEINLSKSALFMDTSYVVPTGSGFPLSLNLLGTGSLNLKMFGSLKFSNNNPETDLAISVRPNIAVNLVGSMSVNGIYGVSGLKLKTNVYSSSSADISIKLIGNRFAHVKVNLPQQTAEIFGLETELMIVKGDEEINIVVDDNRMVKQTNCSWPAIDKTIGLKLCSHIHYVNGEKRKSNPSHFSIAGPAGIRLSLEKSDPTITTYSLEYSWNKTKNGSNEIAINFETPGSQITRLIRVNITSDQQSFNASLIIKSPSVRVYAIGSYRNSNDFKYLQTNLNIDNTEHFDAVLSLKREEIPHGLRYYPKFYMEVNSEKIADMFGTLKWVEKKGILQYDVDLKFQTKRLTSKLFGYVSKKGNSSLETNLQLYYKFEELEEQIVSLQTILESRSTHILTSIYGNLLFETTAYPQFNFRVDLNFKRGAVRLECKIELETNPPGTKGTEIDPNNRLKMLFLINQKVKQDGVQFITFLSAKKPSKDLDLQLDFSYETFGPKISAFLMIKYASDKEITVNILWSRPRGSLEHIKGRLNVTLPSFAPMILEGTIDEKLSLEYDVKLSGTWFSGHSFSTVGIYEDKSTSRASNHRLKFILKSPSFQDVHADCHFYRDNTNIEINLKADQNSKDFYKIFFKHKIVSNYFSTTIVELLYHNKLYTINSSINTKENQRQIVVELHFDTYKDILFKAWNKYENTSKSVGMEIKWDVNRDPTQRLSFVIEFSNPKIYDYSGKFTLIYPGRFINGIYYFVINEGDFSTLARLSWDADDAIGISLHTVYKDDEKNLLVQVESQLLTPFDNWKKTSFNTGFIYGENTASFNASVNWQKDQHLFVVLLSDYNIIDGSLFEIHFRGMLESTIQDIQSMSAKLDHMHNKTKVDSLLHVMYEPDKLINVKSSWQIAEDINMTNLTGSVSLTTPFQGYKKGILLSKIYMTNYRHLRGVADLNLDHKKFTASVKGYFEKIKNNMITFNITTPSEKFKEVKGQIGFSEENKHLVALLQYPSGNLGVEIRLFLVTLTNFDVKFYVATPISFLEEILLVAKLKTETADLRIGWNKMQVGFTGNWHYDNLLDFDHSYMLFTPIKEYEANGIVAKLIYIEGLNVEFSGKMASYKLGFKIVGQEKPKLYNEFDIKSHTKEREPINWKGLIELDTLIYSTMKGTLDIDEFDNVYSVLGSLKLPNGQATLENLFIFENWLSLNNHLIINTPFDYVKVINAEFEIDIEFDEKYLLSFDFGYQNNTTWKKVGALAKYTLENRKEYKKMIHKIKGHIHTPFEEFPSLDISGTLENNSNIYTVNLTLKTNKTHFSGDISTEYKINLFKLRGGMGITSHILNISPLTFTFKKDFRKIEKELDFFYHASQNSTHKLVIEFVTRYKDLLNFKTDLFLQTPFQSMDKSKIGAYVSVRNDSAESEINVDFSPVYIFNNISLKDSIIRSNSVLKFNSNKHTAVLLCILRSKSSALTKDAKGHLTLNEKVYHVDGDVELSQQNMPVKINIKFIPKDFTGSTYGIEYLHNGNIKEHQLLIKREQQQMLRLLTRITELNQFEKITFIQMDTSNEKFKTFKIEAKTLINSINNSLEIDAVTPFVELQNPTLDVTFTNDASGYRHMYSHFSVNNFKGNVHCSWIWKILENMRFKMIASYEKNMKRNSAVLETSLINSKQNGSLQIGAVANINHVWQTYANLTINAPQSKNIQFTSNLKLPPPQLDIHTFKGGYNNLIANDWKFYGKYKTSHTDKNYGSSGKVIYVDRRNINGNIDVEWGRNKVKNQLELIGKENDSFFHYKLRSPYYLNENTFATNFTYKKLRNLHNINFYTFSPESRRIAMANVKFINLKNIHGDLNVTSPFKGFNYIGSRFDFETSRKIYNRYIEIFWPKNKAFIDSKCYTKTIFESSTNYTNGTVLVEIPLYQKHNAKVDYTYKEQPKLNVGTATVIYNKTKLLDGKYKCVSEEKNNFNKDTINIELQNRWKPVGLVYIRGNQRGSKEKKIESFMDSKRIEIYDLVNKTGFNITGEITIFNTETGQNITVTAVNLNRVVKLWTDYDIKDQIFTQHSKLQLEPTAWIAYDLVIEKKSKDESKDAKMIEINLFYPRRNFVGFLEYNLTDTSFDSETYLKWENKTRHIEAALSWKKLLGKSSNHHVFDLEFSHPSFEKNVSFNGEFESSTNKLFDLHLAATYSNDSNRDLKLWGLVERNFDSDLLNYTYRVWSVHPATNLHLDAKGEFFWKPKWYQTSHITNYERTYLPLQTSENFGKLDWNGKELELKRKNSREFIYFWGKYFGKYPVYTSNFTALHDEELYCNGTFYLNLQDKLLKGEVNLTEDGTQCLRAYGNIPDTRSAIFDIWREYEDIWISDVTYFLKMNHSRLIVSNLQWRPELKQEIKDAVKSAAVTAYKETIESIDYWRHFIRAEIADTIKDVSEDGKPLVEGFINDLKELKVVEDDFQQLRDYLNKSYYANEFYIKDLVGFASSAVDALSIRSQLESLPAFVTEIWEIMGESGKKLQKGIQWVIERVKFYYKNTADFINGLLQGDSAQHISDALKKFIEKYDNFIKEMHVSFIRYVENLWDKTYTIILDNWHKTLATIEPTFIKMVHYLETMIWSASKEFLDFLYLRKTEIMESPYFSKLTHFTQDFDKFYKDITGNDTVWKVVEYSKVGWNFAKEKYFELVPFSRELQNITEDILNEVKELKKLPSIQVLLKKIDEVSSQVKRMWQYFDLDNKLRQIVTQIQIKISEISQTALQSDSKYREAKTLFVFEPKDGIMHYEQKLPISWHAFNDLPKFDEIPEYQIIHKMRNYFISSKTTFWNLYYNFKPLLDPKDWFPPFRAQALLTGIRPFFITFDRVFYSYASSCSHLLASDFLDHNFSLAISYNSDINDKTPYELIFVLNRTILHINLFNKIVTIENGTLTKKVQLPFEIQNTTIIENANILTVEKSQHFSLRCNMEFYVCTFELSGWYFGKTAGLWGTMNNERSDDLLSSDGKKYKANNSMEFAKSWALDKNCISSNQKKINEISFDSKVEQRCELLFASKVSTLSACFSRVPIEPFWNMCLKSRTERDACAVAITYINLCAIENTLLRIPEICVKCDLLNGTMVEEGTFINYEKNSVPLSTDVVFIVEAKECNRNIRNRRYIDGLLELIDKELISKNITNNRYGLVLFGGNGVYDKATVVVSNGTVFTDSRNILQHFSKIEPGNGNADIFAAIAFATKLIFRPGVSRTFVLIHCSDCLEYNMKLNYGVINQVLLENDITMHILMNQDFQLQKSRYSKTLFGIDRYLSFSRKDVSDFKGDVDLRKQIKLPKTTLGFCIPLALESDGSIFNGKKLEGNKKQVSKRFATVFAKRIAKTATPSKCQICECTADNSGVSYMECYTCDYPTISIDDYDFSEDDTMTKIHPSDGLYESEEDD